MQNLCRYVINVHGIGLWLKHILIDIMINPVSISSQGCKPLIGFDSYPRFKLKLEIRFDYTWN